MAAENTLPYPLISRRTASVEMLPYPKKAFTEDEIKKRIEQEQSKDSPDPERVRALREQLKYIEKSPAEKEKAKAEKDEEKRQESREKEMDNLRQQIRDEKDPKAKADLKKRLEEIKVTIKKKEKEKEKEESLKESGAIHLKMIEQAIKKKDPEAVIYFTSDYDYLDTEKDSKLKSTDPNFRWLKYEVLLKARRRGKTEKKISYFYERPLTADGTPTGSASSSLKLNGSNVNVEKNDEGKAMLDKFVENKMIGEGVFPLEGITVHYKNVKKPDQTVSSIESFVEHYPVTGPDAIAKVDKRYRQRAEKYERFRRKREIGQELDMNEVEAREVLRRVKRDLRKEQMGAKDQKTINQLKSYQQTLNKILDLFEKKEMDRVTPELADSYQDVVDAILPDEKTAAISEYSYEKLAKLDPPAPEIVNVLKEFGLDHGRGSPAMWMTPGDFQTLIKTFRTMAEERAKKEIEAVRSPNEKKIQKAKDEIDNDLMPIMSPSDRGTMEDLKRALKEKKKGKTNKDKDAVKSLTKKIDAIRKKYVDDPKLKPSVAADVKLMQRLIDHTEDARGMDESEREKKVKEIKDERDKLLKKAKDVLVKIPEDLKKRRDAEKDAPPAGRRENTEWVDNPETIGKVVEWAKDQLSMSSEDLDKARDKKIIDVKQESLKGLELGEFKALWGFLKKQKEGLGVLGRRLKTSSVKPVAGPEIQDSMINKVRPLKDKIQKYEDQVREIEAARASFEKSQALSSDEKQKLEKAEKAQKRTHEQIRVLSEILSEIEKEKGPGAKEALENALKKLEGLKAVAEEERAAEEDMIEEIERKGAEPLTRPKQPMYNAVEFVNTIKKSLKNRSKIIDSITNSIEAVVKGLTEGESSGKGDDLSKLKSVLEGLVSDHEKITKTISDLSKTEEVPEEIAKALKDAKSNIAEESKKLKEIKLPSTASLKQVPAVVATQVLLAHGEYFSSLYRPFTRITHFRDKYRLFFQEIKEAADAETMSPEQLEAERDGVAELAIKAAGKSMWAGAILVDVVDRMKKEARDFISLYPSDAQRGSLPRVTPRVGPKDVEPGKAPKPSKSEFKRPSPRKPGTEPSRTDVRVEKKGAEVLKDFDELGKLLSPEQKEKVETDKEKSKTEKAEKEQEKAKEERRQELRKMYPTQALGKAQNLILELKRRKKSLGEKAQKELDQILKGVGGAFNELDDAKIEQIAREDKSPGKLQDKINRISIRMQRLHKALASEYLDAFINKWMDAVPGLLAEGEQVGKKDRREEEKKTKYEPIRNLLREQFPDISESSGVKDIPTIESPQKMVDKIVSEFEKEPGKSFEKAINDIRGGLRGGGGGGSSKGREKPLKIPPPSLTLSRIKEMITAHLKKGGKGGRALIKELLKYMLATTKGQVEKAKREGKTIDLQDAVEGYVNALKNLPNEIKKLRVNDPSWQTSGMQPSKDAAMMPRSPHLGTVDLTLDTQKDAERLLDEIRAAYDAVNTLIAPDKIGLPPKALSRGDVRDVKKERKDPSTYRDLPIGLANWQPGPEIQKENVDAQVRKYSDDVIEHVVDILDIIKKSGKAIDAVDKKAWDPIRLDAEKFHDKWVSLQPNFIVPGKNVTLDTALRRIGDIRKAFDFGGGSPMGKLKALLKKVDFGETEVFEKGEKKTKKLSPQEVSSKLMQHRMALHKALDELEKLIRPSKAARVPLSLRVATNFLKSDLRTQVENAEDPIFQ